MITREKKDDISGRFFVGLFLVTPEVWHVSCLEGTVFYDSRNLIDCKGGSACDAAFSGNYA